MIPLLHDFEGETVLVFGGGAVGARKARRFAREARVIVISPTFGDDAFGNAELVRAAPTPKDVAGWIERASPALAIAATDDEAINEAVVAACDRHDVLVNRADRSGSDTDGVVVPATVRHDPVVVAVSTGGYSPALSKTLRQWIEDDLDGAGEMARLTGDLRSELKAAGVPPDQRRDAVRTVVASSRVWKALRTGNTNPEQVVEDVVNPVLDNDP